MDVGRSSVQTYLFWWRYVLQTILTSYPLLMNMLTPGRTMGQEWKLYDVGGARYTVRLLLNHLIQIHQNQSPYSWQEREEHSIPTLMMVGRIFYRWFIIFLAWVTFFFLFFFKSWLSQTKYIRFYTILKQGQRIYASLLMLNPVPQFNEN